MIKFGVGVSRSREIKTAVQEAYRASLQKLGALSADFAMICYTYDYVLEPDVLAAVLKRTFKNVPHIGCSTWSAWSEKEMFEGEGGIIVLSLQSDLDFSHKLIKIHSLKEKKDLWSSELLRSLGHIIEGDGENSSLLVLADGIVFEPGKGFEKIREAYPKLLQFGFGTSYGIPQCSLVSNGEVYTNCLMALVLENAQPWAGLIQNVCPEAERININRMSENLVIEIDEKPAFYRLCEHLMREDDLPMMSPDEFRKHMGNLYIVERTKPPVADLRSFGESYRIVSLLGSEMTTGMVAVGEALDFGREHFLGQKKVQYAESYGTNILLELKEKVPDPEIIWMFCATAHFRDKERSRSDIDLVKEVFPHTPIFGVGTHGEYLNGLNHQSALLLAFESSKTRAS